MRFWLDWEDRVAISDIFEIVVTVLSFVFLGLLVVEFAIPLSPENSRRVQLAGFAIWAVFAFDFFLRLIVADDRTRYLKRNWLPAIAVVLPAARVFRVAQAARAVRSLRVAQVVTGTGRGRRTLQRLVGAGGWGFVALLTLVILFLAAAGLFSLESGAPDTPITSFTESLWWTATMVATLGAAEYPVTLEGRILALLVMTYGLAISGYVTAALAVLLLGLRGDREPSEEVAALRTEIRALREDLRERPPAPPEPPR